MKRLTILSYLAGAYDIREMVCVLLEALTPDILMFGILVASLTTSVKKQFNLPI